MPLQIDGQEWNHELEALFYLDVDSIPRIQTYFKFHTNKQLGEFLTSPQHIETTQNPSSSFSFGVFFFLPLSDN